MYHKRATLPSQKIYIDLLQSEFIFENLNFNLHLENRLVLLWISLLLWERREVHPHQKGLSLSIVCSSVVMLSPVKDLTC